MSVQRIQIAKIAPGLLKHRREEFLRDVSLPLAVRGMINVHLEKPWIPNFWTLAIRALKPGSARYLDFPIGLAEDSTVWFFPSRAWWIAHALASHPPDGSSCDVDVHVKFLTIDGEAQEFAYATISQDGALRVLGPADFVEECAWWTRAFGTRAPQEEPASS